MNRDFYLIQKKRQESNRKMTEMMKSRPNSGVKISIADLPLEQYYQNTHTDEYELLGGRKTFNIKKVDEFDIKDQRIVDALQSRKTVHLKKFNYYLNFLQ